MTAGRFTLEVLDVVIAIVLIIAGVYILAMFPLLNLAVILAGATYGLLQLRT
jgi:hypothetical protein